jgi:hypothetical protein
MMVYSHLFGFSRNLRDCCYCSLHGCTLHGPLCDAGCCSPTAARADFTCTTTTTTMAAKVMAVGKLGAVALHRALVAEGSTRGRHLGGGLAGRAA